MSEQHGFEHGFGDRRAIDSDERLVRPVAARMDEGRQDFLAGAGRPVDEDGDFGAGETIGQRDDGQHGGIGGHRPLARIDHGDQRGDAAFRVGVLIIKSAALPRARQRRSVRSRNHDAARIPVRTRIVFIRQRHRLFHEERRGDSGQSRVQRPVLARKIRGLGQSVHWALDCHVLTTGRLLRPARPRNG